MVMQIFAIILIIYFSGNCKVPTYSIMFLRLCLPLYMIMHVSSSAFLITSLTFGING
jgi:hypothetical protein